MQDVGVSKRISGDSSKLFSNDRVLPGDEYYRPTHLSLPNDEGR